MPRFYAILPILALLPQQIQSDPTPSPSCDLYLALSSTSTDDLPTLGLYSGKNIPKDSPIGSSDIVIQTIDLASLTSARPDPILESLAWIAYDTYGNFESQNPVISIIPGFGMLGAYHPGINNAHWTRYVDTSVEHRDEDRSRPSAGAHTSYHNATMTALKEIGVGEEILPDYGDAWEEENVPKEEITREHYEKADELLSRFAEFMERYRGEVKPEFLTGAWQLIVEQVVSPEVAKIIPEKIEDIANAAEVGSFILNNNHVRSIDWLQNHGVCVDNLEVGASTMGVGKGAFAKRILPSGSIITSVPLVPILDRDNLLNYKLQPTPDHEYITKNLLVNYCFSHPQSSMLLYPASPISNYINHNDTPNAKLQWTQSPIGIFDEDWLTLPPEQIANKTYISLMFDIVSTRDIQPGEEVYLDYGPEWSNAWERHVRTWSPPDDATAFRSAFVMNRFMGEEPFRTLKEQEENPYPDNIALACFFLVEKSMGSETPISWTMQNETLSGDNLHPCYIHRHHKNDKAENLYDAYILPYFTLDEMIFVQNIPHHAVRFMNSFHTSNQHLEKAFRHWIGVPDEMFPDAWRDRAGDDAEQL